jgi:hypothetical protein
MGARENLQKMIDRKQEELAELETKATYARIYLQALCDSMKALPREVSTATAQKDTPSLREGTMLYQARQSILAAKRPLHINEILTALGKRADSKAKVSLAGSIGWYVRKKIVFTRPSPNTFGLIEMASTASVAARPEDVELPDSFGA